MLEITSEHAREIVFDESDEFVVKDKGEWISDGKYQYRDIIFEKDGRFYSLAISRTGSYHTDWCYSFEYEKTFQCDEVELKEIITTQWVKKENVNG